MSCEMHPLNSATLISDIAWVLEEFSPACTKACRVAGAGLADKGNAFKKWIRWANILTGVHNFKTK